MKIFFALPQQLKDKNEKHKVISTFPQQSKGKNEKQKRYLLYPSSQRVKIKNKQNDFCFTPAVEGYNEK